MNRGRERRVKQEGSRGGDRLWDWWGMGGSIDVECDVEVMA